MISLIMTKMMIISKLPSMLSLSLVLLISLSLLLKPSDKWQFHDFIPLTALKHTYIESSMNNHFIHSVCCDQLFLFNCLIHCSHGSLGFNFKTNIENTNDILAFMKIQVWQYHPNLLETPSLPSFVLLKPSALGKRKLPGTVDCHVVNVIVYSLSIS